MTSSWCTFVFVNSFLVVHPRARVHHAHRLKSAALMYHKDRRHGESQTKNHLRSRCRNVHLTHNDAAIMTNSAFYSNPFTTDKPNL